MNLRHDDEEAVRHLVALGYLDPLEEASREQAERRRLEPEWDRAVAVLKDGDFKQAAALLEKLSAQIPEWVAPRNLLAQAYYHLGKLELARQQLLWLMHHGIQTPQLAQIHGAVDLAQRRFAEAIERLEYAGSSENRSAGIDTLLGQARLRLGQLSAAESSFQVAIEASPEGGLAWDGLAEVALRRGDFAEAANSALESLDHDMQNARAHYHLGVALAHLDRPHEALQAFRSAQAANPNLAAASRWMARIAADQLQDLELAESCQKVGREIVSRRRQQRAARRSRSPGR